MNDQDKEAFERWWNEEGSGMPPKPGEETEHFARRMTEIAWMNGAYLARDDAKLKRVAPMPIAEPGEGTIADFAAINALLSRYQITAYERAKLKVLPHLAERAEGLK